MYLLSNLKLRILSRNEKCSNINKSLCNFHVLAIKLNCKANCNSYASVFLSIVVRSESSRNAFASTSLFI